ncbi:CPBP family intramembrane glutamic endopeptidase [Teredinibacter waterburyi]|uniref:CPBP family intramembrane glutamic endopeptidase n=1 Tax=Teredinibacter waterburyi TaxID=1500538 RepID=UPI00165F1F93|nr:type II CAAX endopeptidase family protein [Teredinibacter waterburyi]
MKDLIQKNKLVAFTVLAYLISWLSWLPIMDGLKADIFESSGIILTIFFIGAYGPTLAAIILTFYLGGGVNLKVLLKKLIHWRVGFKWNALALLVGPIIYSLAITVFVLTGGDVGVINYGLIPWIPIVFIVPIVFGPLAEELGWRGVALPCLDSKNKPIQASIIIGVIWGAWHTPLFWAATGTAISGFSINAETLTIFFLMTIGSSFIITWLHNNTTGSVFIAVLTHLSMNASGTIAKMFFPELNTESQQYVFTYYVAVLWGLILCFGLFSAVFKIDVKNKSAKDSSLGD